MANPALCLLLMTQGEGRLLARLHDRDPLGSSTAAQAFTVDGAVQQRPVMPLASGAQRLGLFAREPEWYFYKPFGSRLNAAPGAGDDARYTDHEYDGALDLNYMKGRYQQAATAKFNRPDPMRDWDWMNPYTLNLYEYVGNDPINEWDPTGFAPYDFASTGDVDKDRVYQDAFEKARQANIQLGGEVAEKARALGNPGDGNGIVGSSI